MSQPTALFLEQRFPLGLDPVIPEIRDLYDEAKRAHWDPQADIDWSRFDPSAFSTEQLAAARLTWSRRAWIEYTALAETPSLLVRFCLERGREADPKFYLTVRNTEEAWHIECCHRVAELCGGYLEQPRGEAYAQSLNRNFQREVLDAGTPLDPYVAAHCALGDGLELALWEHYLAGATEPVVRQVLARCVADKRRHARFGWLYLESRQQGWDRDTRAQLTAYLERYLNDVELAGYHCVSLGGDADAAEMAAADAVVAACGLGALAPEREREVVWTHLDSARDRLAALGLAITIPPAPPVHR